jgi:hypothetical protein
MIYRKKCDKHEYNFLDAECIGRRCFEPGLYRIRDATLAGSRNTGDYSACCLYRVAYGCRLPLPEYSAARAKTKRQEGWRKA